MWKSKNYSTRSVRSKQREKPTDDLDKKLDELESEKHDLVERIGELSIA